MICSHPFDESYEFLVDPVQVALSKTKDSQPDHMSPYSLFLAFVNITW